jgi:FAD/FMN-containing dehydrogenase
MDCAALVRFQDGVADGIHKARRLIRSRFPRTTKNTAGLGLDAYLDSGDVLDLIIGSEGTLGLITSIEWRLAPIPGHQAGMLVQLRDLSALVEVVTALLRLGPSAVELLDRSFLEVVPEEQRPGGDAVLLVEFEGDDQAALRGRVGDAVRAIEDRVDDVRTALTAEEVAELWRLRHAASPTLARLPDSRRSLQVIEDGCVPLERLTDYLSFIRAAAKNAGIPVVIFGHAGDGHLHVNLLPDVSDPGWEEAVRALLFEVTDEVLRLGGTTAGEHGDGRLRAGLVERVYGGEVMTLLLQVKDAFDPGHMLNPGTIFPQDWAPLERLKTGAGVAVLPNDIAAALRRLESAAEYSRPRLGLADWN